MIQTRAKAVWNSIRCTAVLLALIPIGKIPVAYGEYAPGCQYEINRSNGKVAHVKIYTVDDLNPLTQRYDVRSIVQEFTPPNGGAVIESRFTDGEVPANAPAGTLPIKVQIESVNSKFRPDVSQMSAQLPGTQIFVEWAVARLSDGRPMVALSRNRAQITGQPEQFIIYGYHPRRGQFQTVFECKN